MNRTKLLASAALLGVVASSAFAGNYVGDYAPGDTVDCNFGTVRPSTGASFTLAGSPAISAYKDNGTTESTTGITLTADFDSRTGLNHVRVTTGSDGTFYSAGAFVELVITTGTVDSVSVVGQPVCSFSLTKTSPLRPTTAGRTLDVATTGEAGLDITNIITCTGAVPALGIIDCGTAQAVTGTTLQLRSAANFDADSEIVGATCVIGSATTGAGQARSVTAYTNSTDTATVATWTTTPTGTITYVCFGTAAGGTAADVWANATRTLTAATNITSTGGTIPITSSRVDASVGAYQSGLTPLQPTVSGRTLDVSSTGEAGIDMANVGSPSSVVTLSNTTVGAVSGSVGAVGAGGINAASLATDTITASKLAADVTTELQTGLATASSLSTVGGNVISLQAAVAALNNLSATQVRDIVIEDQGGGGITLGCAIAAITAYVGGDLTTSAGSSTYKDASGSENRITGIVSSPGNRLGTIVCPTYP